MASKWKKAYHGVRMLSTLASSPFRGVASTPINKSLINSIMIGGRSVSVMTSFASNHISQSVQFMCTAGLSQVVDSATSSKAEPPKDKPKQVFITTTSLEGMELPDKSEYTSLEKLLLNRKDLCFEGHRSSSGLVYFTPFSTSIFEKTLFIAVKKMEADSWFEFDATRVLVKVDGHIVLEVAVCKSTLNEGTTDCPYEDRVVGPFAHMLYDSVSGIVTRSDGLFKEIAYLLYMSMKKQKWWNSLQDIMVYVLFWTLEERCVCFNCTKTFLSDCLSRIHHHLPTGSIPGRKFQIFSDISFEQEFVQLDVYNQDFAVTINSFGGYEVNMGSPPVLRDWKDVFSGAFGRNYWIGPRKEDFSRNTVFHFNDSNFDGYAELLEKQTTKWALIHLDSAYNICLSTYRTLCHLQKSHPSETIDRDLLDIKFRSSK